MRLSFLVVTLAALAFAENALAAVAVFPSDGCPSGEAIDANLERLGALASLAQLGSAEVHVQASELRVSFRDPRGESLGDRVVSSAQDCPSQAALAAAVIAAFAGEWAQTKLANPAPKTTSNPPAKPASPAPPAERHWKAELGASFFGIHDGDVGGFGLGVHADFMHGAWMASALFEGSSERERALGPGRGSYRFLRAGLGLGGRWLWTHLFWDVALLPMIARLSLQGRDLETNAGVADWGFVLDARTRLGWNAGRVRPYLFVGGSYSVPRNRMTLMDRPEVVPLSIVNVEAGIGISFVILP